MRNGIVNVSLIITLLSLSSIAGLHVGAPVSRRAPRFGATITCNLDAPQLTGSQKRALRSHAGRLAASKKLNYVTVAEVDKSAEEVRTQLAAVELVRCKFQVTKKAEAKVMAEELASACGATVAEVLGHTALLYRPSEKRLIDIDS